MNRLLIVPIFWLGLIAGSDAQSSEFKNKITGYWLENDSRFEPNSQIHVFRKGKYSIIQNDTLIFRTKFEVIGDTILQFGINYNPIGRYRIEWVDENYFLREKNSSIWAYNRLSLMEEKEFQKIKIKRRKKKRKSPEKS
jgi:hypothetical protein